MAEIEVLPLLHNVFSPQRLIESARTVYGLGYRVFIVTKASGSAAQVGVPEAQKLALKLGKSLIYLPDLPDAIEMLKPDHTILVVPKRFAKEPLTSFLKDAGGRILVVFGGSDPGLSRRELEMGLPVFVDGIEGEVGVVGLIAITLYLVRRFTA